MKKNGCAAHEKATKKNSDEYPFPHHHPTTSFQVEKSCLLVLSMFSGIPSLKKKRLPFFHIKYASLYFLLDVGDHGFKQ